MPLFNRYEIHAVTILAVLGKSECQRIDGKKLPVQLFGSVGFWLVGAKNAMIWSICCIASS